MRRRSVVRRRPDRAARTPGPRGERLGARDGARVLTALTRATVGGAADQDYAVLAGFLFSVLLVALVIPAP